HHTGIYPLSLHDALPIWTDGTSQRRIRWTMNGDEWCIDCYSHVHGAAVAADNQVCSLQEGRQLCQAGLTGKINSSFPHAPHDALDRKSTRLNSSHSQISY